VQRDNKIIFLSTAFMVSLTESIQKEASGRVSTIDFLLEVCMFIFDNLDRRGPRDARMASSRTTCSWRRSCFSFRFCRERRTFRPDPVPECSPIPRRVQQNREGAEEKR
ncbi:hypothetical protein PMAYCL1PPCAC_07831, partial [Pristionchus mayeri]